MEISSKKGILSQNLEIEPLKFWLPKANHNYRNIYVFLLDDGDMFELNSWQIHSHVFTPFQFPGGWPLGKVGFKSQSRPEFVPFRKLFLAHPQLEQCQAMMILKGFYLTACFYPFGDLILGLPGHLTSSVMVGPRWMREGEIKE